MAARVRRGHGGSRNGEGRAHGGGAAMKMPVLTALAAVVIVLAGASVAGAEGWGAPDTLALPSDDVNDQQLVATPAGEAVAGWIEQGRDPIRAFAAIKRADGTLDGPVEIAGNVAGCVLDIATDAAGGGRRASGQAHCGDHPTP